LARLSIIDTECGATSVILAQSLFLTGTEIPKRIGTALAYGILTDTLNLYRAKRSDIIKTYISLLPFCDLRALTQIQNPPRSRRFFVTLEKGIKEALIYGKLIITHLGWVENPDVVSQITEFLLTYEKMRYSFCTGRYKEKLHFSLRAADPNFLAADVLRDIVENPRDAGGHDAIAGGSFFVGKGVSESIWQDTEKNLAQKLIARLKLFPKNKLNSPMRLIG
jgi:nanoRNase/pAp phosphatase (c-di-AMP/oligoRNAs hydrolase)